MSLEETVSRIVREVVTELLLKKEKPAAAAVRNSVMIVVADERHAAEVKQLISDISASARVIVAYCGDAPLPVYESAPDSNYEQIVLTGSDRSRWSEAVQQADIVVLPVLSIGTLVKIASLIDDEPSSGVIVNALVSGKEAVVSSSYVLPTGGDKLSVPPAIQDAVSDHLQLLSKYGVHVVYMKHLAVKVTKLSLTPRSAKRPLIHAKHVRDWVNEGETEISLSANVLMTPLAKEEAKLLGLTWRQSQEGNK
ncbi:hypothetical protein [Paenibacillus planticolens]|uniref:Flavoprotein domain-containing protein n=1 Tax=Paenibacillus planticolens TaxID=2654976 RepID=A0ABX1ZIB2_9BACL|nr:hypothetical protein [Paenibacillus planticolens]NOU99833.1 hypothetical protein [Paenibacillus planticolens]